MKKNNEIIIEQEKYLLIDSIDYNGKEYYLINKLLSNEILLCEYNEEINKYEIIQNKQKTNDIMFKLKNKYETTKNLDNILKKIGLDLEKLRIVDIENDFLYSFKDENGNIIKKHIEFYMKNKPKINNYIFMSKNIIKEKNIFQYGEIYDLNNIKLNEVIKINIDGKEIYLQRYYG